MTPSKSDLATPVEQLTELDKERVQKYKQGEAEEVLGVIGQESETKAAPWVRKIADEQEEKERKQRMIALEMLTSLRKNKKQYIRFLSTIFLLFSKEEDVPKRYRLAMDLSDEGLAVFIGGTPYYGAFAPSGIPPYDYHACKLLAVRLGNTIAKLEGYHRDSGEGILIPWEDEKVAYGRAS